MRWISAKVPLQTTMNGKKYFFLNILAPSALMFTDLYNNMFVVCIHV